MKYLEKALKFIKIRKTLRHLLCFFRLNFTGKWRKKCGGEFRLGTDNPVMVIFFDITNLCNYKCSYCFLEPYSNRPQYYNAFKCYPVDKWIESFRVVSFDYALTITGRETFMLKNDFPYFLENIAAFENAKSISIVTNGSLIPKLGYPSEKVREKTTLMVSYHPTQVTLDAFVHTIDAIRAYGWRIGMFNYVMEDDQAEKYEEAKQILMEKYNIFLNASPDIRFRNKRHKIKKYLPWKDLRQKTRAITFGKLCFFPAIAYGLTAQGIAYRQCIGGEKIDFINNSKSLSPLKKPIACPCFKCWCFNNYAFLENFPERGRKLDLFSEYSEQLKYEKCR